MESMTYNRIIPTSVGSRAEGQRIARELVEKKLAACVNILPAMESVYRWKGKTESAEEFLLVIKSSQKRWKAVRDTIKKAHSYELPEIISIAIEDGSKEYLKWLAESVKA
jgi:periplasmic divalent cation tolerance protein